jgi:3'(2'), 5'-bisphosphate nucleotidase
MDENLVQVIQAAVEAGSAILGVYESDFAVTFKDDKSPLTEADRRAHAVIVKRLGSSAYPLLSEEGRDIPFAERCAWETLWIVDPLDGTKEFIKRNGEFTVNIALVHKGRPVLGVIYVPVQDTLYFASTKIGAYKLQNAQVTCALGGPQTKTDLAGIMAAAAPLQCRRATDLPYTIVGSRSHSSPELEAFVDKQRQSAPNLQFVAAGSSLKFCLVAEGRAHIYPRLAPTMEWDTAAGQAIAENAGATVQQWQSRNVLAYNKESLLNPWFVVKPKPAEKVC